MPNVLPMVFIALAAVALLLTLIWLWQSLRLAFVHAISDDAPTTTVSFERSALLAEKKALLLALKDLEAERDSGKLSQEDFVELNDQYRTRARAALRKLDALLAPHRADAKALLQNAVAEGAQLAVSSETKTAAADGGVSLQSNACSACSTANDTDAVFCKKCGMRLGVGPSA